VRYNCVKGDPGITSVSVKMMGKDTLEETDKFIERDLIARAVPELRRARGFMRRDSLSILNCPSVLQVRGDPDRAERVAAGRGKESSFERAVELARGGAQFGDGSLEAQPARRWR
jgi:hypothetical protein